MDQNRVVFMGDFSLLRDAISRKKTSFLWVVIGMIDAILRGVSQVILVNNTISGLLILVALASTSPGAIASGLITGLLGLLVSMLIKEAEKNIENGLTIYNPVLIGCVTYVLLYDKYGSLDAFVILVTFIATILSVYMTKALSTDNFPCVTIPFNIIELMLIIILLMQKNYLERQTIVDPGVENVNTTAVNAAEIQSDELIKNMNSHLDWGMIFRGIITSSSQVFAIDDVAAGAVIYLAILIYSPITAVFSLLGAVVGCFASIGLDVPYKSIYSGFWGYNSLLSSAAFGGLFITFNHQTVPLAFAASSFTVLLQFVLHSFLSKIQLPVLSVPFVITFNLFLGLREGSESFIKPRLITFPEEHRLNFLTSQRVRQSHTIEATLE